MHTVSSIPRWGCPLRCPLSDLPPPNCSHQPLKPQKLFWGGAAMRVGKRITLQRWQRSALAVVWIAPMMISLFVTRYVAMYYVFYLFYWVVQSFTHLSSPEQELKVQYLLQCCCFVLFVIQKSCNVITALEQWMLHFRDAVARCYWPFEPWVVIFRSPRLKCKIQYTLSQNARA